MPRCARSEGRWERRSSPANVIVPDTGGTTPQIVLNKVDLPAPFGPTRVTNRRSTTDSVTSVSARRPPYATERFLTSSTRRPRRSRPSAPTVHLGGATLARRAPLAHAVVL